MSDLSCRRRNPCLSGYGRNIVDVAKGNKTVGEAAGDIAIDTVKAGAVGYGAGAVGSMVASTATGAAVLEAAAAAPAVIAAASVLAVEAIISGIGSLLFGDD
ncbi:hypothetical protein [Selenomonas ruminis]|uniref:Bacteriocin n=1 Tax=Selenomonas ruminis TaxID=2593411 RepID=A0A5D6W4U2_9FIRM|nr:hypothetical protein [Selenomonas sp. mPRGC5]TYZ22916.1 hypothetical protein FZ040_06775 [Selenomonas sp. mPRGC5]